MSTPGANFQCFGDIFPYLTDELVESEGASVENMIDSLYNYGLIHGDTIQGKLEKSPFYTKEYKKITPKQQQLLRAERVKRVEVAEESDYSEDEPVKIKQSTKKGKAKAPPKETALAAPTLLNSGRTFVGVSFISPGRSRGDEKSGRGNKAGELSGNTNQNTFEATITVSNRRISVGSHPTVELAAQAHDRALIRANGPMSYKQAGLLNYPLSFYASDSLSKFSIFDTLLRKQLFGSDWTGPKPVDFGFLMTQHSKVPTKRGADFNAMDGSGRKKRHKGQYREGDDSGSDCDFGIMGSPYMDSGSYKKKKLLYGNYYVTTEAAGREDAETAEPYFKSPGNVLLRYQLSFFYMQKGLNTFSFAILLFFNSARQAPAVFYQQEGPQGSPRRRCFFAHAWRHRRADAWNQRTQSGSTSLRAKRDIEENAQWRVAVVWPGRSHHQAPARRSCDPDGPL